MKKNRKIDPNQGQKDLLKEVQIIKKMNDPKNILKEIHNALGF